MSEKRDLWVPAVLLLAGIGLLVANVTRPDGSTLAGVLGLLVAITGALVCLPLRIRVGQGRVIGFGGGMLLLLLPFVPGLATSPARVLACLVAAAAFLVPLRRLPQQTRVVLLAGAGLMALLGLVAMTGALPRDLAWLFLAGALFLAMQVRTSKPPVVAETPAGPRVAIFGGSFDPFHRGHRALAEAALRVSDRLLVVVAGSAPHKFIGEDGEGEGEGEATPFHHRVAMTRLGLAGLPRTEVLELEGRRQGPSYTVDTVEVLKRSFPPGTRFRLLLGADMFVLFPTWHQWERLLGEVELLVAARPGFELVTPPELEDLGVEPLRLEAAQLDVSSSDIRERIAAEKTTEGLLQPTVAEYVEEHGLYA